MQFREYRRKDTIRAAEITEEKMILYSALARSQNEDKLQTYGRGDYAENRDGELLGYTKADFDSIFGAVRAPRQSKTGKPRKARATTATTGEAK